MGLTVPTENVLRNIIAAATLTMVLCPLVGPTIAACLPPAWGIVASLVGIRYDGVEPWALPVSQTTAPFAAYALVSLAAAGVYVVLTRTRPVFETWISPLRA